MVVELSMKHLGAIVSLQHKTWQYELAQGRCQEGDIPVHTDEHLWVRNLRQTYVYGVFHKGTLIAAAGVEEHTVPDHALLYGAAVDPEFQGMGFYSDLLKAREKMAQEKRMHTMAEVLARLPNDHNTRSLNILLNHGYGLYQERTFRGWSHDYEPRQVYVLKKELLWTPY